MVLANPLRVINPPVTQSNRLPPLEPVDMSTEDGVEKMPVPIILFMIKAAVDIYPSILFSGIGL